MYLLPQELKDLKFTEMYIKVPIFISGKRLLQSPSTKPHLSHFTKVEKGNELLSSFLFRRRLAQQIASRILFD
jgi:hypothetical protein